MLSSSRIYHTEKLCKYSSSILVFYVRPRPWFQSVDDDKMSDNNGIRNVQVLDKNIDFAANVVSGAKGQLLRSRRKSNLITPKLVFSHENPTNGSLTPDPPRNPPTLLDLKLVKSDQDLSSSIFQQNAELLLTESVESARLLSPEGAKSGTKEPKPLLSPLKWFKSLTKKTNKGKNKSEKNFGRSSFSIRKWLKGNHLKRKKGKKEEEAAIEGEEEGKRKRPSSYLLRHHHRKSSPANNLICVQQFQLSKVNFQTEFRQQRKVHALKQLPGSTLRAKHTLKIVAGIMGAAWPATPKNTLSYLLNL